MTDFASPLVARDDRLFLDATFALARGDLDAARAICASPSFEPTSFVDFLVFHRLAGLVHVAIDGTPLAERWTRADRDRLAHAYLAQWTKNERLAIAACRLALAFGAAGCGVVFLKGHHLALELFGDLGKRGLSDVDLLVRPDDAERAAEILRVEGWTRRSRALFGERAAGRFTHAAEFDAPAGPVDLHWLLANHPSYRIDYDALWARRRPFHLGAETVDVLDSEYALVFRLVEIAKDVELGSITLKPFVDVHAMLRVQGAHVDWNAFFAARRREGIARTCASVLGLALDLFGPAERRPDLENALERNGCVAAPQALRARIARPGSVARSFGERIWAARLYETSLARAFGWWAVSLPFRIDAHRPARDPAGAAG